MPTHQVVLQFQVLSASSFCSLRCFFSAVVFFFLWKPKAAFSSARSLLLQALVVLAELVRVRDVLKERCELLGGLGGHVLHVSLAGPGAAETIRRGKGDIASGATES